MFTPLTSINPYSSASFMATWLTEPPGMSVQTTTGSPLGSASSWLAELALELLALDVPVEEVDVVCVRFEELHGLCETFRERGVGGDEDLAHTSASA